MMKHTPVKGFTLVETLVAVSVISFAIVGPFYAAQGVLTSSYIARDQLIAGALAQEGMEYIRGIRDSNLIYKIKNGGSGTWMEGLDGSNGTANCYTGPCTVDPTVPTQAPCPNQHCEPLYVSDTSLYTQTVTQTPSRFTRKVELTFINATSTKATVTVSWSNHGAHSVILTEVLTDWL